MSLSVYQLMSLLIGMKEGNKQQQQQQTGKKADGIAEQTIDEGPLQFPQESIILQRLNDHYDHLAHDNGHVVGF